MVAALPLGGKRQGGGTGGERGCRAGRAEEHGAQGRSALLLNRAAALLLVFRVAGACPGSWWQRTGEGVGRCYGAGGGAGRRGGWLVRTSREKAARQMRPGEVAVGDHRSMATACSAG
jgi:hypothetical protein